MVWAYSPRCSLLRHCHNIAFLFWIHAEVQEIIPLTDHFICHICDLTSREEKTLGNPARKNWNMMQMRPSSKRSRDDIMDRKKLTVPLECEWKVALSLLREWILFAAGKHLTEKWLKFWHPMLVGLHQTSYITRWKSGKVVIPKRDQSLGKVGAGKMQTRYWTWFLQRGPYM